MFPDLRSLNPPQREAVQHLHGPMLVLAGAGTGKTRVITIRMAQLIASGVAPDRILSVTFTNKAAKEMGERTRQILGGGKLKARPWISTFHALCVQILRSDIERLGYPRKFTILDRGDQESIARGTLRDIRVTEKSLKPGDMLSIISGWKSAGLPPGEAAAAAADDKQYLAAMAYRKYQQKLKATGSVDFDDLLLLTAELFEEHPDILDKHQQRFSHVQIDEYQDTNGIQFRLIEALVAKHKNLCVVGDDDQSIYGWRGADVAHILNFGRYFPGAKIVRLEDNYRCTDHILECANRLVRHNRGRHGKVLRASKKSAHEVRFVKYDDENLEAEKTVFEIRFYIQKKGIPARDFAILFRTNEQPRIFESELRRQGIPYTLIGSQSFFDRKEIKDLMCYLKAIDRPTDEASLLRIINVPPRGIGDSTSSKILEKATRDGRDFWVVARETAAQGEVSKKAAAALDEFHRLLQTYTRRFEENARQMDVIVRELIEAIHYDREIEKQYPDPQAQLMRQGFVDEFVDAVAGYLEKSSDPTLTDFLDGCALNGRDDEPDKEKQAAEDAVKLMTLHSAKGLEFPRVYMVGMEENILPHKRSVDADTAQAIEEERRLCYVGITRAQEFLTMSRAESRIKWGSRRPTVPSRFLREMRSDEALEAEEAEEAGENE
ncbi:ATP-dependent DNA helicase PcrA [Caulifigura coniformis]|uniref:DNA 3'-5' helicase n=1 Tax=Caulifigura coniformis TaxID=2527983 RepID=A0A517SAL3_9PLAN|nr:UvrD-helicase domain-containing protein [Caulifigura coniformis]QDT53177.1 ATP-dependent DNA helicase PcrA [Caulifigura coniformis]